MLQIKLTRLHLIEGFIEGFNPNDPDHPVVYMDKTNKQQRNSPGCG
jgi:hypothetical protein